MYFNSHYANRLFRPRLEAVTNRTNILQNLIYVALVSCFNFVKNQYTYFWIISPEDFVFPYANKDFRRDDSKVSVLFLDIIKTRIMQ